MEIVDPFAPSFPSTENPFGGVPDQWTTPFNAVDLEADWVTTPIDAADQATVEAVAPENRAEPTDGGETATAEDAAEAPQPAPVTTFSAEFDARGVDRAKELAHQLSDSLSQLQQTLDVTEDERDRYLTERGQMLERIHWLEGEAARKEQFKESLLAGLGATISSEDLESLQGMTDALTADPDRLTVLFNVVQQASKLGTVVTVFNQLRHLAEES